MKGMDMDRLRTSAAALWLVAVIGFPIGGFLGHMIAGPASTATSALLSGLIAGAVIGLAQALSLGLRAQALAWWTIGTAAALAAALGLVTVAIGQIETSTEAIALGAVSGVVIGAVQAFLFMRAGVAASAVAWAVGWLITSGIGVALAPGWPVYGLSGAIASQVITAVALWRLVPSRETLHAAA